MASSSSNLIDGKAISAVIRTEIREEVEQIKKQSKKCPGLCVIIVGERKDSQTYVRMKKKAAAECGFEMFDDALPAEIKEDELLKVVEEKNSNPDIDGILVQLPLPDHINEERILNAISVEKDVDGFHPVNIGKLAMKGREPNAVACTPKGCMELLARSNVKIEGKNAVVVGRSNIVGIPMAMLLLKANATVTVCHSRTADIPKIVSQADIIVAALGSAHFVRGDWVKEGAVVIDVGMNSIEDATKKSGYRLVGDVAFDEVAPKASLITPVPGGVGPMTVAMLMKNTLEIFKKRI